MMKEHRTITCCFWPRRGKGCTVNYILKKQNFILYDLEKIQGHSATFFFSQLCKRAAYYWLRINTSLTGVIK